MLVFHVNSVDSDQMLHSAASDLGLHCLQITLLGVFRLKWAKAQYIENCFTWLSALK